jgi:DhnA family fructose-bisphosphate aldolase class Ia
LLPALVIHLSAGTLLATEPASKVLSATVESAAARGADAVSVQIHFGTRMEGRMVADAGTVVDEASAFGLPVLAMAYGPSAPGSPSSDAEATRHAVRAATELGVSLVQTSFAGDSEDLRSVVRACPVPLLFAGGPRASSPDAWLASIRDAMDAGAAGITAGRNLFQAADPAAFANQIGEAIFGAHPLQGVGGEG